MADAAARVTGQALRVSERSGTKTNETTGESKAWKMVTARILVGGENVCEVTLPTGVEAPERGEDVDWLVSIRSSARFLNIDYVSEWAAA